MAESSNGKRSVASWVVRGVLLLALGGCSDSCRDFRIFAIAAKIVYGKKPSTSDRYLAFQSTGSHAGATFRPNRRIWKPFRYEARVGFFDAAHANLGSGSFGISMLEYGATGRFFILEVKRSGDGIVLEAGTGGAPIQTLTIPDSLAADVVMDSVGGLIQFSARKPGAATYTPIAVAVAPSAGPYQLSLDANDVPKGTIVGFDLLRVATNGAPASPTAADTARETIYTAIDALAEAGYALDGAVPDRAAAGDSVELAIARLDAALALDLTPWKGVGGKVASTRKKASAQVAPVRGAKPVTALLSALRKIVTIAGKAAGAVE